MKNKPMRNKKDIETSADKHIDQDFEGYPHGPAKDEIIKPSTKEEKKTAAVNVKDGEKIIRHHENDNPDDGSANAFEGTEEIRDDED